MNITVGELYIGLMSGTSMDAVDAVLVDLSQPIPQLLASHTGQIPDTLQRQLNDLNDQNHTSAHAAQDDPIHRLGTLDTQLGRLFAETALALLAQSSHSPKAIRAIGSHGQTIRHHPHAPDQYTLQIADPNIIAAQTGITTVADFRRRDMALGGQGAPLTPAFHHHLFYSAKQPRAIVNIGGISNMTLLLRENAEQLIGFDCGPGNTLLDHWCHQHQGERFDQGGQWASQGRVHDTLLTRMLKDPYFQIPHPKSTGPEYFSLHWLTQHLQALSDTPNPTDVQTTLVELTAHCIINSLNQHTPHPLQILLCGGGAHNDYLVSRLQAIGGRHAVMTTQAAGVNPDWLESIAFAWLAKRTLAGLAGNVPAVTGANRASVIGAIYPAHHPLA